MNYPTIRRRLSSMTLASGAIAVFICFCLSSAFGQTSTRARTNQDDFRVVAGGKLYEEGGNLGACVQLYGIISNPPAGHEYQLRYLIRVQTETGADGAVLGDEGHRNGVCYTLLASKNIRPSKDGLLRLYETVDITRSMIRKLHNMPKHESSRSVVLRVEPHVFDVTSGTYVTKDKTDAAILVASVRKGGYVGGLKSLSAFILGRKSCGRKEFVEINQILKTLDTFDCSGNELPNALADVLDAEHLGEANQLLLLNAIRSEWITGPKERLEGVLHNLAENGTDKVKQVSGKLLNN